MVQSKYFDFVLRLCLYEYLELLKAIPFWFQHIQPYLPWRIINKGYRIPFTVHRCILHGTTHVRMHDFQRFSRSSSTLIRKRSPILFALDAHFTKQGGYGARKFAKVYTTYYVLEGMNTLHVQMAKTVVPKVERVIFHWRLYQIGHFRFVYLHKIDFVKVAFTRCNHNGFTITRFDNIFV